MKILITLFICFLPFFLASCKESQKQRYERPPSVRAVHALIGKIAKKLTEKYSDYKLRATSDTIAMPGGIVKCLGINFQIRGPLSKEEIRKVLIALAHDFNKIVNEDEGVRPYLKEYPFPIERVEISLFLRTSTNGDIDDPEIGIAGIINGEIDYMTQDHSKIPSFKTEIVETYAEALKALQGHCQ